MAKKTASKRNPVPPPPSSGCSGCEDDVCTGNCDSQKSAVVTIVTSTYCAKCEKYVDPIPNPSGDGESTEHICPTCHDSLPV